MFESAISLVSMFYRCLVFTVFLPSLKRLRDFNFAIIFRQNSISKKRKKELYLSHIYSFISRANIY